MRPQHESRVPSSQPALTQEDLDDLGPENVKESLSTALILRSSRGAEVVNRSQDQDLDAVVSAKVFDAIAGGFEDLGKRLEKVGLKAGEAAGNAAMVVPGLTGAFRSRRPSSKDPDVSLCKS